MNKETFNQIEKLSNQYKEENSELSIDDVRNNVLYKGMIGMEDCQLKAAIHEHLKSIGYYQTIDDRTSNQSSLMDGEESVHDGECWCFDCDAIRRRDGVIGVLDVRMNLCPDCGNKRCPKATNHDNSCTNSNESGQDGSRY